VTDLDYSSNPDTDIDSDFISDRELESDIELEHETSQTTLPSIVESPGPNPSGLPPVQEDSWSVIDGDVRESDAEDFESGSEFGSGLEGSIDLLQPRLQGLSLDPSALPSTIPESQVFSEVHATAATTEDDPDRTVTSIRGHLQQSSSPRRRDWVSARSASSPSRSPARVRRAKRRAGAKKRVAVGNSGSRSFYEYLFT